MNKTNFKSIFTKFIASNLFSSGTFFVGTGKFLEQIFRFSRNLIIVRILAPEALGIFAIVLSLNAFFESLSEVGIRQAVIQNKDSDNPKYLNGAFIVSVSRSIFLYITAFFLSPFISQFYQEPTLTLIIRIAFLGIIFRGLISPKAYIAIKNLKFRKWVFIENGGSLIGITATIILSLVIKNVLALVLGFALEHFSRTILSYLLCPFKPTFKTDLNSTRPLLNYAKGMIGLPILTFIYLRADTFVIGKVLTFSELGLYSMVLALANMPISFSSSIINTVLLPTLSKLQDDYNKVNELLFKVTGYICIICFPLIVFSIFYGKVFLLFLYGNKYANISTVFTVILISSILRLISMPIATLYLALGRPSLHRTFTTIRTVIILLIIYPMTKYYGLVGASLASFFALAISFIFQTHRLRSLTNLNLLRYYSMFFKYSTTSIIIILTWFFTRSFVGNFSYANITLGFLSYLVAASIFFIPMLSKNNIFTVKL